jgi:four helix bundle protein
VKREVAVVVVVVVVAVAVAEATSSSRRRKLGMFGFQKLDVYRCAVTFLGVASTLAERMPRGHSALADQLRRAALSVPLNIAEGSGKGTMEDREARRFYAIARGSALECAAIVDALQALRLGLGDEAERAQELLERIVSMLTKMARVAE